MICVIAKLPPYATGQLAQLKKMLLPEKDSAASLYGHITVATFLPDQDEIFISECEKMIRETPPFSVIYEKTEVLHATSILVATPAKSEILASLHDRIAQRFRDSLDRWTRDENWYPHTTLLYHPEADLDAMHRIIQPHFIPFEAHIQRIELSRVEKNG